MAHQRKGAGAKTDRYPRIFGYSVKVCWLWAYQHFSYCHCHSSPTEKPWVWWFSLKSVLQQSAFCLELLRRVSACFPFPQPWQLPPSWMPTLSWSEVDRRLPFPPHGARVHRLVALGCIWSLCLQAILPYRIKSATATALQRNRLVRSSESTSCKSPKLQFAPLPRRLQVRPGVYCPPVCEPQCGKLCCGLRQSQDPWPGVKRRLSIL